MLGMEMMLSNLIGMKPEEMQKAVKDVIAAIDNASKMLTSINERLTAVENHLNMNGEQANGHSRKLPSPSGSDYIQL